LSKFPGKETWVKRLKTTNESISLNELGVHFNGEMSLAVIKTVIWLAVAHNWRYMVRNIQIGKKKEVSPPKRPVSKTKKEGSTSKTSSK